MSEVSNKYMLSGFFARFGSVDYSNGLLTTFGEFYLPYAPIIQKHEIIFIKGYGWAKVKNVLYVMNETQNLPLSFSQNTILFLEIEKPFGFDGSLTCGSPTGDIFGFDINGDVWINFNNAYPLCYIYESATNTGPWVLKESISIGTPETGFSNYSISFAPVLGNFYKLKFQDCGGNILEGNVFNYLGIFYQTSINIPGFNIPLKAVNISYSDAFTEIELWESISPLFVPYSLKGTISPLPPGPNTATLVDQFAGTLNSGYWYYARCRDSNGNWVQSISVQMI